MADDLGCVRAVRASAVDEILTDCELTSWLGAADRCHWCNARLPRNRSRWCSAYCARLYAENHVWAVAKARRRATDKGCVDCREAPAGRPGLLEVDHVVPCDGKRAQGCQHHQANLRTRCQAHHAARHRAAA